MSSSESWKLLVFSHDATHDDGQQSLVSVNLETALGGFAENRLRVEFSPVPFDERSRGEQLHFIWHTVNVFVRISPATSDIGKFTNGSKR